MVHESGIGECNSGGNVLRRRIEERRWLSGSASSDMKMPVSRARAGWGQQGQVIHRKGERRRGLNGDGCARIGRGRVAK
jgi:hypothetical protein